MRFLLLLCLASACSINHRSDQFACTNVNQCDPGQRCEDGFCVGGTTPGDGPDVDPDGPKPDTFSCPPQCTSCNIQTNTCNVDCGVSPGTCANAINCPAGFNCNIICTRNDLCQNINCSQGESCKIDCKGNATCKNVVCGPGRCDVTCSGGMSCPKINCESSCACDISCGNNASCIDTSCPQVEGDPFQCEGFRPNVCNSEPDGCNTCM